MRDVLDPLAHIPGVRLAALLSADGVPISTALTDREQHGEPSAAIDQDEELNSWAALAAGWLAEVTRAALQLSWEEPARAVLCATQGTLVLHRAPGAVVMAVLERGVPYEELRVPIEGAIARMQRVLRAPKEAPEPLAPLPTEPAEAASAAPATHPQVENRSEA